MDWILFVIRVNGLGYLDVAKYLYFVLWGFHNGMKRKEEVWLQGFLVFPVKGFQGKSLFLCVNDLLWSLFFLKESLCFTSLHRFKAYSLFRIPLPFQATPLIKYINVFFRTVILSFRLLASTLCWQLDLRIGYLTYPQNQQLLLECIIHMVLQCM